MTDKKEIIFWKKAIKIIEDGYGKPCKSFNWDCCGCRANLMRSWIESHVDLLEWKPKEFKTKK